MKLLTVIVADPPSCAFACAGSICAIARSVIAVTARRSAPNERVKNRVGPFIGPLPDRAGVRGRDSSGLFRFCRPLFGCSLISPIPRPDQPFPGGPFPWQHPLHRVERFFI